MMVIALDILSVITDLFDAYTVKVRIGCFVITAVMFLPAQRTLLSMCKALSSIVRTITICLINVQTKKSRGILAPGS